MKFIFLTLYRNYVEMKNLNNEHCAFLSFHSCCITVLQIFLRILCKLHFLLKIFISLNYVYKIFLIFIFTHAMLARVFATATCPSVRTSVYHTLVLCLAERKQDREMYTI